MKNERTIFDYECVYICVCVCVCICINIYIFAGYRDQYDILDICAKLFVPNPLYRDSTLNEINGDLIEIRNHRHC